MGERVNELNGLLGECMVSIVDVRRLETGRHRVTGDWMNERPDAWVSFKAWPAAPPATRRRYHR